ncbi:ASCH domain-containing protein [Actinomadura monticuli]|uniref:ASCH domain-containing protein n=1 Tax=Actinomadura monticuli TaxID=3097367 RepID=UPI003561AE00
MRALVQTITPRTALLALKPRFAEAILGGSKTVELRRQRVGLPTGTILLIYASSPVMAILGTVRVVKVDHATPAEIWSAHRRALGLSRTEFDSYLEGTATASAISLEHPNALDQPISLSELRGTSSFHPPQSYCFVSPRSPEALRVLAALDHPGIPRDE